MNSNSVKNNYIKRIEADIFRIIRTATIANGNVLRVELSKDLSSARVFVSGDIKEFENMSGFLKTEIANNMSIRKVPNLKFIIDVGEQNAQRVEELLRQIKGSK